MGKSFFREKNDCGSNNRACQRAEAGFINPCEPSSNFFGQDRIKALALEKKVAERATENAREYADAAVRELEAFENSRVKESLANLAQYCLERVR